MDLTQSKVVLMPLLRNLADEFSLRLTEHDALTVDLPEDLLVWGSQVPLEQVFANLIDNAIKYRDPHRPLRITITRSPLPSPPTRIVIAIADTGLGIPSEKLDEVFRPFRRLYGAEIEGTGVGLACVKRLIEKLSGDITVESTPAQGTTFHLTLSRATPS